MENRHHKHLISQGEIVLRKIQFIFLLLICLSCQENKAPVQNTEDFCSSFKNTNDVMELFSLKNGQVESIILDLKKEEKLLKVKLQMNKKPIPRVQTLSYVDSKENIPVEWRKLAGSAPDELILFFHQNYSVVAKTVHFIEYPGFGGKRISWINVDGVITCSVI